MIPMDTLWGIAYACLVPTALAYFLNAWAMGRSSSTLAAAYVTLQPVFATMLAVSFRGETAGAREAVALALIIGGLALVSRKPPEAKEPA